MKVLNSYSVIVVRPRKSKRRQRQDIRAFRQMAVQRFNQMFVFVGVYEPLFACLFEQSIKCLFEHTF